MLYFRVELNIMNDQFNWKKRQIQYVQESPFSRMPGVVYVSKIVSNENRLSLDFPQRSVLQFNLAWFVAANLTTLPNKCAMKACYSILVLTLLF